MAPPYVAVQGDELRLVASYLISNTIDRNRRVVSRCRAQLGMVIHKLRTIKGGSRWIIISTCRREKNNDACIDRCTVYGLDPAESP
jgi:hypothetical protein